MNEERFNKILQWSVLLTAEQCRAIYPYKPSIFTTKLVSLLKRSRGQLIVVTGFQGTGKTALKNWLSEQIPDSLSFKWSNIDQISREFKEKVEDDDDLAEFQQREQAERISSLVLEHLNVNEPSEANSTLLGISSNERHEQELTKRFFKYPTPPNYSSCKYLLIRHFGKKIVTQWEREARNEFDSMLLNSASAIIVDFPDYSLVNRTQREKDVAIYQDWWIEQTRNVDEGEDQLPNQILFWQAEIFDNHFFFGKFEHVELVTPTAIELSDYFIETFGGSEPFTREALEYIASLGRYCWRWYKKYIKKCLVDASFNQVEQITIEHVKEYISIEDVQNDWKRELATVFPKARHFQRKAVRLFRALMETEQMKQSDIIEEFFDGQRMTCSRFLDKLQEYGYIDRNREGREKIITYVR